MLNTTLQTPLAKGLDASKASSFCFEIVAFTDIIGGNTFGTLWRAGREPARIRTVGS